MNRFVLSCATACLVAAFATACGGSNTSADESQTGTTAMSPSATSTAQATAVPPATGAASMTITNMSFGEPITVSPGAQVTIKNDDSAEHSVTSDTSGKFDVDVEGKEQATLTAPTEPGEYAFHCTYHPSMHGTLIVK
jgi:plastocyanin